MEEAQTSEVKPVGAVRRIDSNGRFSIPVEAMKLNGWARGTALQIFADQTGGIYLRKFGEGSQKEQLIEQLMTIAENVASKEIQDVVNETISYLRTEG
ncbi:AbrB family transcriptional regulator [Bacillus infantis]|uniref:AbrB family transcriptional regulator n=1 Tax=Bacillus infantis TaxID=324767 RepID=UPI003981C74C